jgi:hypothetical protein
MLVIGVSLLSVWKSLSAGDFQSWFAFHSHLVGRLMTPLGAGIIAVTVERYSPAGEARRQTVAGSLIAAVSITVVMVTYPLFSEATNEAFV